MKRWVVIISAGLYLSCPVKAQQGYATEARCPILDRVDEPVWQAVLGYTERADVDLEDASEFGVTHLEASSGLLYLRSNSGDFDIRLIAEMDVTSGDGGIDMPDQYGEVRSEIAWIGRFSNGNSMRVRIHPGLYSDFEDVSGDDFFFPFGIEAIKNFSPEISGLAGFMFYPDFKNAVDPHIGLRWVTMTGVTLDLFYPKSRVAYAVSPDFLFFAALEHDRVSEYQLEEDDPRDRLIMEDTHISVGMNQTLSDSLMLIVEAGRSIDRSIEFDDEAPDADVDPAFFIRFGVGGWL